MSVNLAAVIAEHHRNVGFVEGPNNKNPWGPEQGIANAAYCDSAASMVPYHNGYRWWPESQCGEKGCAYTVSHVQVGQKHGEVMFDHPGAPCDVLTGDLLFYDWSATKGVAANVDHVETAIEDAAPGGRTHNVGYNTGSPNGCHDLWRDRKYLVCRLRPLRNGGYSRGPQPVPEEDDMADPAIVAAIQRIDTGMGALVPAVGRLEVDMGVVKAVLKAGAAGEPVDVDAISKDILDDLAKRLES